MEQVKTWVNKANRFKEGDNNTSLKAKQNGTSKDMGKQSWQF